MLDAYTYRLNEKIAQQQMHSWRYAEMHRVSFNDHGSFPTQIETFNDLAPILDTMQENRFDNFMEEIGGLNDQDLALLVNALVQCVIFQKTYMPGIRSRLPITSLLAHLVMYKRIDIYNPDFSTVLEIGPGCGYLAYYLSQRKKLDSYVQVEASEAFYLLQNNFNTYLFGPRFDERAICKEPSTPHSAFTLSSETIDYPNYIDRKVSPVCTHIPWWRLGELKDLDGKFEIVLSNANLREFTHWALRDYLYLIEEKLSDTGILFCQCLGGPVNSSLQEVREAVKKAGLAAIVWLDDDSDYEFTDPISSETIKKYSVVGQGVFVKRTHPLFETFFGSQQHGDFYIAAIGQIPDMFIDTSPGRKMYSREQIALLVDANLQEIFC